MVARIVSGKSIRGVLVYNETKLRNAEAQLLLASGFPRSPDRLSFKNKLERFEKLTRQNERTKTNALHITLNFSKDDTLDEDLIRRIALDYMERIGFGNQPFLVYQHFDTAHPHIHIVTVNIAEGGGRIETHNIGKYFSEKARKEIEIHHGLIRAEDQKKEMTYMLRPARLEKAVYGRSETKAVLSGIVREVVASYKFASLPELNAILRQFNVAADRGEEGSRMYEKKGLVYSLLDEEGNKIGIPIKASSIYSSPTLTNLEKQYASNQAARKPYAERLKYLLDKTLAQAESIEELRGILLRQGVRILLRKNDQGRIYGVTFIDNATRVIFNGSRLGKAYSAGNFMERLGRINGYPSGPLSRQAKTDSLETGQQIVTGTRDYPARELPVIEQLWDAALSDRHNEEAPGPFRKRKKKRKLPGL